MTGSVHRLCLVVCGAALVSTASAQDTPPRPTPANDPGTWIGAVDYPAEALVAHAQGAVGFTLSIDPGGTVTSCTIASSSGSEALDKQTCSLLMQRARFNAVAPGGATRSFSSRLRWVLPVQAAAPTGLPPLEVPSQTTSMGAAELTVGSDGIITACAPFDHPYVNVAAPPDLCSSFPIGSRYSRPTVHGGKPVRRRVRIQMTVETGLIPGA